MRCYLGIPRFCEANFWRVFLCVKFSGITKEGIVEDYSMLDAVQLEASFYRCVHTVEK